MLIRSRHTPIPLLYWATERENIRLAKEAGHPPPWTADPILQKYRFCNVRRKDDRVSRWLIINVLNKEYKFQFKHVFLKWVALSRWINWPPTLQRLIDLGFMQNIRNDQFDPGPIGRQLDVLVAEGTKAWTGAYMVRAPSKKKYPGVTKGQFVADIVVSRGLDRVQGHIWEAVDTRYAENVWEVLVSAPNWGSFMAGQVVADLTYTPILSTAYDLFTWAPQGPGSRRGFNRLLNRPLKAKIDDVEWSERLQRWRMGLVAETGLIDMTLHDVQNCLCEVDKYLRVKAGEGRPRSTYKPETSF